MSIIIELIGNNTVECSCPQTLDMMLHGEARKVACEVLDDNWIQSAPNFIKLITNLNKYFKLC